MGCHKCLIYIRILFYTTVISIHAANIIVILNAFTEDALKIKGVRDIYETRLFFFTCWNFGFQIAYAAFALFCDWMSLGTPPVDKKSMLPASVTNFREKVFTVMVWPSALMVSTYFWAFYAYDRSLLYPEYFDVVVTPTSNHIMHTLIAPIVFCELVLFPRRKPESSVVRVCCIVALQALYVSSLFFVHCTKGIWVYPIFGILNDNNICLAMFLGVTALYLTILYYGQFCVSKTVLRGWEKIGEKFCRACKK